MAHNDYENDYETLSKMIGKLTLRKKQLAMEMFKTVNNLKPDYISLDPQKHTPNCRKIDIN